MHRRTQGFFEYGCRYIVCKLSVLVCTVRVFLALLAYGFY